MCGALERRVAKAVFASGGTMWPLTGIEIITACEARCQAPGLDQIMIAGVAVRAAPPAPDELFVALREDEIDGHRWAPDALRAGAPLALVAAGWPGRTALPSELEERCIVALDPLRALRRLASFLRRRFPFPVIAVGGSNGKTTTKEMIAALLSGPGFRVTKTPETMNGFTGLPITIAQRAHAVAAPPHALVVEIGIDAVGAMAEHAALVDPDVAVLTALGPEHLDGLGSWDTAAAEELLLFEASPRARRVFQARDEKIRARLSMARAGDIIVCEEDDAIVRERAALSSAGISLLTYRASGSSPLVSDVDLGFHPAGASAWRASVHVPMAGRHNADNLAVAFGAALAVGRTARELLAGWPSFTPPGMRCQPRPIGRDGLLIDDAYNASPPSMAAALSLLESAAFRSRRKVVILGDMLDLGAAAARYHLDLVPPLSALSNAHLCLFGDRMREVHEALSSRGASTSFLPEDRDPRAFLDLPEASLEGAVVLVKGSRGMRLERVVDEILQRSHGGTLDPVVRLGVVGSRRGRGMADWLAAELDRVSPGRYDVVWLEALALARWPFATGRFHGGIFTDFEHDRESASQSPEQALAVMAQLFMQLPEGGVALLASDDPASDLLAEIVPSGVRLVRYGEDLSPVMETVQGL